MWFINLLIYKIKLIVALRLLILSVMLNDVFPKSNVVSVQLMLTIALRKVLIFHLQIGNSVEGSAQLILY